jgi:hypothetical protein
MCLCIVVHGRNRAEGIHTYIHTQINTYIQFESIEKEVTDRDMDVGNGMMWRQVVVHPPTGVARYVCMYVCMYVCR